ncbi:hypothetical protein HK103_003322 [Boothiomyces macroporosus]|uniref:histone acetyltransferase n=1 Tax=Boothiomyces macroporosus TaxID=261099 RepID=A0AAD5UHZ8_9FUNG|nr:hypothetical protein HK103_003322 [Boothiomyces macroporosus]
MEEFVIHHLQEKLAATVTLSIGTLINSSKSTLGGSDYEKTDYLMVISNQNILCFAALFSHYKNDKHQMLYLNKIDTSGYSQIPGLPRTAIQGLIGFFAALNPIQVHVYCATSEQYLFHSSSSSKDKKILADRQLVAWWLKTVDVCPTQKNYIYVPGESLVTIKKMLPSNTNWNWGFAIDKGDLAEKLPAFEDDLITKGLQYSSPGATVAELMEVMDCMESAGGVRAVVTVHVDRIASKMEIKERKYSAMTEYCGGLLKHSFASEGDAKKSTINFLNENELKLTELTISNNEKSVSTESKRKSENISDITNLIKKKKK